MGVQNTYVSHESTTATPSLSILLMHYSRGTKPQSLCVEPSERSCDSLTGQGERASVERCIAAGHLKYTVNPATKAGRKGQTFHLIHFVQHLVESDYKYKSARIIPRRLRHIPKSRRIPSIDVFPSNNGTGVQKFIGENHANYYAPSITTFMLLTRPWTTPKVCAAVIRASSWVNRSNF